jgi:hypothetical protein
MCEMEVTMIPMVKRCSESSDNFASLPFAKCDRMSCGQSSGSLSWLRRMSDCMACGISMSVLARIGLSG